MYVLKDVSISWKHHNYAFVDCTSPSRISLSLSVDKITCSLSFMKCMGPFGTHVGPMQGPFSYWLTYTQGLLWGTNFNHSHTKNTTVEAWADRKLKEPTGHSRFFSHYPPTVGFERRVWKHLVVLKFGEDKEPPSTTHLCIIEFLKSQILKI